MGNYEQLKQAVKDVIKTNGNEKITGQVLQNAMLSVINSVGANSQFAGIATPSTNPGTPDQNVFYLASKNGTYVNLGGVTLTDEVAVLKNINGSWVKVETGIANVAKLSELENTNNNKSIFKNASNKYANKLFKEIYIKSNREDINIKEYQFNIRDFKRNLNNKWQCTFIASKDMQETSFGLNKFNYDESEQIIYLNRPDFTIALIIDWNSVSNGYQFYNETNIVNNDLAIEISNSPIINNSRNNRTILSLENKTAEQDTKYTQLEAKKSDKNIGFIEEFYCSIKFNISDYKAFFITDIKKNRKNLYQLAIAGITLDNNIEYLFNFTSRSIKNIIYKNGFYVKLNWNYFNDGYELYINPETLKDESNWDNYWSRIYLTDNIFNINNSFIIKGNINKTLENPYVYKEPILSLSEGINKEDITNKTSKYDWIRENSSNINMGNKSCAILYNLFKIGFNRQILYSYSRPYNFPNNAKLVDGVWVEKTKEEIVDEFNLNNIVSNDYQPIIYGIEMNRFIGTWLDVYEGYSKEQQRAGTLATIKYYYNKYKLIPNFTWHIENPYVPTAWKDPKYGRGLASRYRYSSEGYPQEHRYVINEILNNTGGVCGTGTFSGKKGKEFTNPKAWFDAAMGEIKQFISELKDENGEQIPCIFRPLHEMSDDWQFWGTGSVSTEDFKDMFKLIVDELKSISNEVLICYCPDSNAMIDEESYFTWYQGDDYVDLIGFDDYTAKIDSVNYFITKMNQISVWALKRNKIPNIGETDAQKNTTWYSSVMMKTLKHINVCVPLFCLYEVYYVIGQQNEEDFNKDTILKNDLLKFLKRKDILKRNNNLNLGTIE